MKIILTQLKWQFILLQKNNIISISLGVTMIYGILLYFLRDSGNLDMVLVSLVLNDPSVIGFFFVALAIYTEIKCQILPALFSTPLSMHAFLLSKTVSISIVGLVCSLGLAISVKGFDFHVLSYSIGALGICVFSTLLGIYMLTFADEFLKFTMLSIPVFLVLVNVPLLQYLGVVDLGWGKYLFPIQGCLDLIGAAIGGAEINYWFPCVSMTLSLPLFYWMAFQRFNKKVVNQ